MPIHTLTSVKEKEKQTKQNELKQFLEKTSKTVNFLKDICCEDNKKIAKLTAQNKSLKNENIFYKEEIENLDKILDEREMKIQSLLKDNNNINNDINSFGLSNLEYDKMMKDRDKMFNEMVNDESIILDKEFEKIKAERKRKNEERKKKYNI